MIGGSSWASPRGSAAPVPQRLETFRWTSEAVSCRVSTQAPAATRRSAPRPVAARAKRGSGATSATPPSPAPPTPAAAAGSATCSLWGQAIWLLRRRGGWAGVASPPQSRRRKQPAPRHPALMHLPGTWLRSRTTTSRGVRRRTAKTSYSSSTGTSHSPTHGTCIRSAPRRVHGGTVRIEFLGCYRSCLVFVNGGFVGAHESGYTSFSLWGAQRHCPTAVRGYKYTRCARGRHDVPGAVELRRFGPPPGRERHHQRSRLLLPMERVYALISDWAGRCPGGRGWADVCECARRPAHRHRECGTRFRLVQTHERGRGYRQSHGARGCVSL